MRKTIIALILGIVMAISLTGCNMGIGFGDYSFYHVHISDQINSTCATVSKWYDDGGGIEVNTKEYGSMFLSEGTYQLFESAEKCPYCKNIE